MTTDELRAIAERATKGPWFYEPNIPEGGDRTGSVWSQEPLELVASKPHFDLATYLTTFHPARILAMLDVIEEAEGAVGWAEIEEHALGHSLAWADDLRAALARLREMER